MSSLLNFFSCLMQLFFHYVTGMRMVKVVGESLSKANTTYVGGTVENVGRIDSDYLTYGAFTHVWGCSHRDRE